MRHCGQYVDMDVFDGLVSLGYLTLNNGYLTEAPTLQYIRRTLLGLDLRYNEITYTVYPKKYAQGFVVLCIVVVMQSFIMNSHEEFIHIHQGCFAGTGAIARLPQCQ